MSKKTVKAKSEKANGESELLELDFLFQDQKTSGKKGKGFISKLLKKDWKGILLSALLYLFQNAPAWVIPLATSSVIDLLTLRPEGYLQQIILIAVIVGVLILQNIPSTAWRLSVINKISRNTTACVRKSLIRKLHRLSITYHKDMEDGRVQAKFLRDIEGLLNYYRSVLNSLIPMCIGIIVSTAIALSKKPVAVLFFVAIIPINVCLSLKFRKPIRKESVHFRKENEELSVKLTTTLQMMTLTKAHGLIDQEETAINEKIYTHTKEGLKLDKVFAFFSSSLWVSNQLMSMLCFFGCAYFCLKGYLTVGEVVLFQSLFNAINNSIVGITNIFPQLLSGAESFNSLAEIMQAEEMEYDGDKYDINSIEGNVDFHHVYYTYPREEKMVIKDFDLHVKKGETIALVGSSGSGKSTIMNLIIGLIQPTSGEILVDGKSLHDLPLQRYRRFLSIVPQNSILFSGTVRENITYGVQNCSEERLQQAVKDAHIDEFLPLLGNGLDSQVGEHGDKLSGGQKQRIAIARALIRNPSVLILDEATSALDNASEFYIQKAIERLTKDRTTFIVAHRLSTIRNADRIVVLEEGRIVEVGDYETLVKQGGRFTQLDKLNRIHEEVATAKA